MRDAGSTIAAAMLEAADPSTGEHSDDVELVVGQICARLSVKGEEREDILVAARLHDVGKVAIPREVLEKEGPLDDSEWELIKEHTITGERILRTVPELAPVAKLVRHSHEHFDGSGYPDGLKRKEIPFGSRIILCADAFHAIRSDRPYRKGRSSSAALKEMKSCAGTHFDPEVVDALDASIKSAKFNRRTKLPPRLAILFAMLAIGTGGAFAAERGWIPSPIPGLGPERSDDADADSSAAVGEPAEQPGTAAGDSTTSDDDVAGTGDGNGDARGSGQGASTGLSVDRRGGDGGRTNANNASGPAAAGSGGTQDDGGNSGGEAQGDPSSGHTGGGSASATGGDDAVGAGGSSGVSGGGSTGGGSGSSGGESPGNSGSAPGQTGSTPGQSGSTPGQSGTNPGNGGAPPGQSGTSPGQSGTTPGQSGVAPGQSGAAPGNSASAPGQSGVAPGNSGNAPGQGGSGGNPHV